MEKKIPLLIDCDPGMDDAVALAVVAGSGKANILGVGTVGGNQSAAVVTRNARNVLDFLGLSHVPVAAGADKPLFRQPEAVTEEENAICLPAETKGTVTEENVILFYESLLETAVEPVTVLALGPLTNIAVLLKSYPRAAEKIEKIVVMGGANMSTPNKAFSTYSRTANYNFYCDAEAAHMVFAFGIPVYMVGADVTYPCGLSDEEIDAMAATEKGAALAQLCRQMAPHYKQQGYEFTPVQDAVAAVYLLHPEYFETQHNNITIGYTGKYTYGASLVDLRTKITPSMNTWWVSGFDRAKTAAAIVEYCRG